MLKRILLLLMILSLNEINAYSEGRWNVNGYELSNVNVLHRGNKVEVSGRIQNGQAADYLRIRILVSNDNGFKAWCESSVQQYSGKGELFEAKFDYYPKARQWNIEKIDVIGNTIGGVQNSYGEQIASCTVTSAKELMITIYNVDRGFKESFRVGPNSPYQLNVKSGHYRAEFNDGINTSFKTVNLPAGSSTWRFQ